MPLRTHLPSPTSLFMFEAAARHLSFTRAAADFNVTQSAVSRMIKRLETHLGAPLFVRGPTGLALTEDGARLFSAVSQGFRTIEAGFDDMAARRSPSQIVSISVSSAFAMHWFVPAIDRFKAAFPDIDLRLQIVKGEPVGPFEDVDLAVRHNHPECSEHHSWHLMDEVVVPVCSQSYAERHGTLASPGGEPHVLANQSGALRLPWPLFLERTGAAMPPCARGIVFSDYALVVQAALKGRALALGWMHVVGTDLLEDGLVPAGGPALRTGLSYDLVATTSRPLRPLAILVRDWLIGEMSDLRNALDREGFLSA